MVLGMINSHTFILPRLITMNEKQIQRIIARAEERLARGCSKEEARLSLQQIGVLDANGELSPDHQYFPYAIEMYPNHHK
jgi:hypothetical protein